MPADIQATANQLAALQAADCVTTTSIIAHGGYERNPLARAVGASRSPALCLAEAAAINLVVRRTHSPFLVRIALITEAGMVANNLNVIWRFH